jgi:hypothetical protein
VNTHRFCTNWEQSASATPDKILDLQVMGADLEYFRWIFDALDGKKTSWLSRRGARRKFSCGHPPLKKGEEACSFCLAEVYERLDGIRDTLEAVRKRAQAQDLRGFLAEHITESELLYVLGLAEVK